MMAVSQDALWDESEASPDIPPWVRAATARLDKTLFAPFTGTLDKLELAPYRAGAAMGFLVWGTKSLKNVNHSESLRRELKKLKWSPRARRKARAIWQDFFLGVGFLTKGECNVSKYIPKRVVKYLKGIEGNSLNELSEFYRGYAVGLEGIGICASTDRSDLASEIYFALVSWWRFVVRFKSLTELHEWLTKILGEQKVGDRKRVEKICERIGLKFRKRGRPRNPTRLTLPDGISK
jgi:hypothetical protein